jgi:hypothetical protein
MGMAASAAVVATIGDCKQLRSGGQFDLPETPSLRQPFKWPSGHKARPIARHPGAAAAREWHEIQ